MICIMSSIPAKEPKPLKPVTLSPDLVTAILKDHHTEGLSVAEVRKKHNISAEVWRSINTQFGKGYVEKYGSRKTGPALTADDMQKHWSGK